MKNVTAHRGILEIIERLPSSSNGNPRYLIRVDGWVCKTGLDSNIGYKVTNYDGKQVIATIGTHYGKQLLYTISEAD